MGPAPMPKLVGILDDGKDKNGERDEAKLKLLVCVASPLLCWMYYLFITRKVVV